MTIALRGSYAFGCQLAGTPKPGVSVLADDAEPVAEGIAAEGDGWPTVDLEFLLAFCAAVEGLGQKPLEIVDAEIDMNGSPVAIIAAA